MQVSEGRKSNRHLSTMHNIASSLASQGRAFNTSPPPPSTSSLPSQQRTQKKSAQEAASTVVTITHLYFWPSKKILTAIQVDQVAEAFSRLTVTSPVPHPMPLFDPGSRIPRLAPGTTATAGTHLKSCIKVCPLSTSNHNCLEKELTSLTAPRRQHPVAATLPPQEAGRFLWHCV